MSARVPALALPAGTRLTCTASAQSWPIQAALDAMRNRGDGPRRITAETSAGWVIAQSGQDGPGAHAGCRRGQPGLVRRRQLPRTAHAARSPGAVLGHRAGTARDMGARPGRRALSNDNGQLKIPVHIPLFTVRSPQRSRPDSRPALDGGVPVASTGQSILGDRSRVGVDRTAPAALTRARAFRR